jgi:hypothetical protein
MLNCTTAASQLACVRSKPATVIQTIIDQAALTFTPTSDGVTQLVNGLQHDWQATLQRYRS